jgi:hypothetical protein
MLRSRSILLVVFSLTALTAAGCYSPYMRWPDLYHPGSADYQRAVAEKFDPYPSPDTGPEVVGGRPLGYQRPLNESEWANKFGRPDGAIQPAPFPVPAGPPVFTTPYPPSGPVAPVAPTIAPGPSVPYQIQPRSPY